MAKQRVQGKPKKTPTYNLTLQQIADIKQQATKEAAAVLIELTLGLPTMVLHDKFGFGKVRLERFLDATLELYDSHEKGYLTLEDIRATLWEEGGIRLEQSKVSDRRRIK